MRGQVHTFPPDDSAFRRDVLEAWRTLPVMDNEHAAEALAEALRATYRNVTVTAREELGGYGDEHLCYAFRDGRVRTANEQRDRLYGALAHARDSVSDSEAIMEGSRTAMGQSQARHPSRRPADSKVSGPTDSRKPAP